MKTRTKVSEAKRAPPGLDLLHGIWSALTADLCEDVCSRRVIAGCLAHRKTSKGPDVENKTGVTTSRCLPLNSRRMVLLKDLMPQTKRNVTPSVGKNSDLSLRVTTQASLCTVGQDVHAVPSCLQITSDADVLAASATMTSGEASPRKTPVQKNGNQHSNSKSYWSDEREP